tara:strand:+ start:3371 stop:4342 length:972 start_codon:yes stop_codon:yes gene_type:complete
MPSVHKPRAGSLQFWPRKRAKRIYSRVRSWGKDNDVKLLGFAGYKAGMTHIVYTDNKPHSPTKGEKITTSVTVIECPPLKFFSLRCYKQTSYGLKLVSQINNSKVDKNVQRKVDIVKKVKEQKEVSLDDIKEVRVVVYTQPGLTGLGKKKPEVFEVKIGGDVKEAYEYGKQLLEKEVKVSEIFEEGQFVDIHAISKGYGFEGPIKRFGISLKSHKSEKKRRSAGNLGAWTPSKTSHTVPQHGQRGFHQRTEYNKQIFKIGNDKEEVTPKGDFLHYGKLKNEYLLVKGSIPGSKKRLIQFGVSMRGKRKQDKPEISYISKESKQ